MTDYNVPPDVERIAEGLRDTGYEVTTAIADIIDNSISAGASLVDVRLGLDFSGHLLVSIGDNGCGMDQAGLINAMKYGSKRRTDPASLGKFGLGLKTASTAFCRRLVVISRSTPDALAQRAVWDLDYLAETDTWNLQIDDPSPDEIALLDEVSSKGSGTVVLWDRIDRLLGDYKKPDGRAVKNALKRLVENLRRHIATVYQRFLDAKDSRARTVTIKLNGSEVDAWDPFCLAATEKPELQQSVPVELPNGTKTAFTLKAYILPRKEEYASDSLRQAASISNELQGVYVYRENRLIHGPDWLGMFKQEPHFSLLRVELSFSHELDEAFQVDIKKSRILLNNDLYEWLRDKFLAGPRREAETRYRKGAAGTAKGAAALLHAASNNAIAQRVAALKTPTVTASDQLSGSVELDTNSGHSTARLRIVVPDPATAVHIATSSTLDNGVLWEVSLIGGNAGVALNTAHPYYIKAYLPNKENSPVVQALDFLLWALAQAELNNANSENKEAFEEFRIEVSRNLKKLVADLPDPAEPEGS